MRRDHLIGEVRALLGTDYKEYVLHVYSKTFNPEALPVKCPYCAAAGMRRQLTIDGRGVDVVTCATCRHVTVFGNGTVIC